MLRTFVCIRGCRLQEPTPPPAATATSAHTAQSPLLPNAAESAEEKADRKAEARENREEVCC